MGPFILLILFQVSLNGAQGNHDWFFEEDFNGGKAKEKHDYARDFWTGHNKHNHNHGSGEEEPSDVDVKNEAADYPLDSTSPLEPEISYYLKRKQQALKCKDSEHLKLPLDEFGEEGCQLCTCNSAGMMLCTRMSCEETGDDIGRTHELMLREADLTNSKLIAAANRCDKGTTERVGTCTCTCVLPSVLSCPGVCFDIDYLTTLPYPNKDDPYDPTTDFPFYPTTDSDYETTDPNTYDDIPTGSYETELPDEPTTTPRDEPITTDESFTSSSSSEEVETTTPRRRTTTDPSSSSSEETTPHRRTTTTHKPTADPSSSSSEEGDDNNNIFVFINVRDARIK